MSFWTPRSAKNSGKSSPGGVLRPHRRQDYLLVSRVYDETRLPVPYMRTHRLRSSLAKCRDVEIVTEFRSKMRAAEEMISKLAFSLKEIQGMRKMAPPENSRTNLQNASKLSSSNSTSKIARIRQFVKPVELLGK